MKKRNEFKLRFKDDDGDWTCIVRTKEEITKEDFANEVLAAGNRLLYTEEYAGFTPVELFDELCESNGWEWEDYEYDETEVSYDWWD